MNAFERRREVLLIKSMAKEANELSDLKTELNDLKRREKILESRIQDKQKLLSDYKNYLPNWALKIIEVRFLQLNKTLGNL